MALNLKESIVPANEAERIKALKRYEILDTPPDGSFDRITSLASRLLNVPIAIVSLVDTDRIWFKSHHGLSVEQIDRDPGLCASAILSDEVYHISNAIEDPRSLTNPLVAGEFGLRFYAAAPLKSKDGFNLGTLCVIDQKPRSMTKDEEKTLEDLAAIVMDEIELRMASRKAVRMQSEIFDIAAHDMKNPIISISSLAEMIIRKDNKETINEMAALIKKSSDRMIGVIDGLLETALIDAGRIKLKLEAVNIAEIATEITTANQVLAKAKDQGLTLRIESNPFAKADREKIRDVFNNLVSNAIKFTEKGKSIVATVKESSGKAYFEVKDEGQGLTDNDKEKLFGKFTRLSARPTGGETSTGLGLSIVKMLVELQQGKIFADSEGKGQGSTFTIELPTVNEFASMAGDDNC